MTVVSEGPLCLKIHLNKYELKKYFISYEKIVFDDPQVKKTIEYLFNLASSGIDFETYGKKIIEVFPAMSGGCIIKFTTEPTPFLNENDKKFDVKSLKVKNKLPKAIKYLFMFSEIEALLTLIQRLFENEKTRHYNSGVYSIKNKYFLRINIPLFDRKTPLLINEYSDFSARGNVTAGIISEYGKCLITPNAIEVLGSYFS